MKKMTWAAIMLVVAVFSFIGCPEPGEKTVNVSGVTLDHETLALTYGGANNTGTLTATITPNNASKKDVTWSVSPATGVVSLSATTGATITVTAANVSVVSTADITVTTQNGKKTAVCKVTVSPAGVETTPVTGVTLDKSALSFLATDSAGQTLTATIAPATASNKAVSWTVTPSGIVNLSSTTASTITVTRAATTDATATITVTTMDGSFTATCAVTVTTSAISATGVTLDKTTLSLPVNGAASPLTATVAPATATNKTVNWSMSAPGIVELSATTGATINVAPVATGTVTITATTVDGNFTATCAVTVAEAVTVIDSIAINQGNLEMVPLLTNQLSVAILPADLSNKDVTWGSSNANVAAVSEAGVVTAVANGTTTITVTSAALGSDGLAKTASITVLVFKNNISLFEWNADTDTALATIGGEGDNTTDPFSAAGPSIRGAYRLYNDVIMQNYIWTGNFPTPTGFAPANPGPMRAVQTGAVVDEITLTRGGYIINEMSSPNLLIGTNIRGRTSTSTPVLGQLNLSTGEITITIEYTPLRGNTVGLTGEESAAAGTDSARVASLLVGIINNGGNTTGTLWPAASNTTTLADFGTVKTYTRTLPISDLTTAQLTAIASGFLQVRVTNSNCGGRAVIHSVKIESALPTSGNVDVDIPIVKNPSFDGFPTATITLNQSTVTTHEVTLENGLTGRWYFNGVEVGTGGSYTVNSAGLQIGNHHSLTLVIEVGGQLYSKTVAIHITR